MKTFVKPVGFFFVVVAILTGIAYAAVTINTITSQTIRSGDTMGIGWFQAANDRLPPVWWNAWDVLVIDSSGKPSWGCGGGAGCAVVPVVINSCATTPAFANLGTPTTGTPTSVGQAWAYSVTPGNCTYVCTGGYSGVGCATAPMVMSRYPWCDTDDIAVWTQIWSACNVGATKANENASCIDLASCTTARVWNYYNWDNAILPGTCSDWYRLPIKTEWKTAYDLYPNRVLWNPNNLATKLKLPLAGYSAYGSNFNMGTHSMYWSSTPDVAITGNSFFLEIWSAGDIGPTNSISRIWESSVRCIKGVAVITNSCAAAPSFANIGTPTTGTPTTVGQAWTYSATPGNCTYACNGGYSGTNCATAPVAVCDTPDLTLSNGQVWSMCNVGATTNGNTAAAYGNYYSADSTLSPKIASSACTAGYHLPSKSEWQSAYNSYPGQAFNTAANLPTVLKLSMSGYFHGVTYNDRGAAGYYWSSTPYPPSSSYTLYFTTNLDNPADFNSQFYGFPVRCIKDGTPVNSCAAAPAFANVGTATAGSPTSFGQAWTYSATPGNCTYVCTGGYSGTNCATAPIVANRYPWCDTDNITLSNGQIWAMCNVWASTNGNVTAAFGSYYSFDATLSPNVASNACAAWYHLPSHAEWQSAYAIYSWQVYGAWDNLAGVLKLPLAYYTGGGTAPTVGSYGFYWSSTPFSASFAYSLKLGKDYNGPNTSFIGPNFENYQGYGYSIRCLKN